MVKALRPLLPKICPGTREREHWLILPHQGKSDLERSFPRKLSSWGEPHSSFIILRDNDGADCGELKRRLVTAIPQAAPPHLIRIVCQHLESWLLGDLDAVRGAYPHAERHRRWRRVAKSDPDRLTNAAQLLMELTGTAAKRIRAAEIAEHMDPLRNRSKSFQVFRTGVARMMSPE